jgi:hypothetical protein
VRTAAPEIRPSLLNWISTNLPKREELSLRTVFALPKASSSGFDSSTCSHRAAERVHPMLNSLVSGRRIRPTTLGDGLSHMPCDGRHVAIRAPESLRVAFHLLLDAAGASGKGVLL